MRPLARKHDTTTQVRPGATIEVLGRFEENQNKQETQKTQEVRGKRYGKCLNMNRDMEAGIAVPGWSPKGAVEGVCGGAEDAPWMQCGCCRDAMWIVDAWEDSRSGVEVSCRGHE